jgi:AFG3 family protein
LAGRAAEEVFFKKVTTGASDDLRRVTSLVYNMIQTYGMNERVGQLAFPKDPSGYPGEQKPYSDATAQAMDEEARRIVDDAYARTLNLIQEKKDEVDKIAQLLLQKETITHDDIVDVIGERPFKGDEAYNDFVSKRKYDKDRQQAKEEETAPEEVSTEDENAGTGNLAPGLL